MPATATGAQHFRVDRLILNPVVGNHVVHQHQLGKCRVPAAQHQMRFDPAISLAVGQELFDAQVLAADHDDDVIKLSLINFLEVAIGEIVHVDANDLCADVRSQLADFHDPHLPLCIAVKL